MTKEKNIVFSKEIDSIISGIALGVACISFAILVYFFSIFHNVLIDRIVSVGLILLGICGFSLEVDKIDKNRIYGFGDFSVGIIICIPSIISVIYFENVWLDIMMAMLFLLGAFGTAKGLCEIIYSIYNVKKSSGRKIDIIKFITFFTEVIALIVIVLQLIAEIIKL